MTQTLSMLQRCCVGLLVLGLFAVFASPASAQTPPTIDGDMTDLIAFAEALQASGQGCALIIDDPAGDIAVNDPLIDPCPTIVGNYYANGFDQTLAVIAAFDGDVYLGIRVVGTIGDPDGDGTCNNNCLDSNVPEQAGIGSADSYIWFIDSDCSPAFSPDIEIEVTNNTVQTTGLSPTGTEIGHVCDGGHDLEVRLDNVDLFPLFTARAFSGNTFDGLGEDLSAILQCPPPNIELLIEKVTNTPEICPGTAGQFQVTVTNPSVVALDVIVEDVLPAGFSYVGGSTSGIGEPAVNGQTLTWPMTVLGPGESVVITFSALSGPECDGPHTNLASAIGQFVNPCIEGGSLPVGPVEDSSDIVCVPASVDVSAEAAAACVGSPATVPVTVTNTSSVEGDISLDAGIWGTYDEFDVAPGASRVINVDVLCEEVGPVQVDFTATITLDGLELCQAEDETSATVTCFEATVLVVATDGQACVGDEAVIDVAVTNTSASAANVILSWTGGPGSPANLGTLAAGETVNYPVAHVCDTAGETQYNFTADLTLVDNQDCTASDSDPATATCREAAVTISALDAEACVGDEASVPVTVTNPGSEAVNVTVEWTVGGVVQTPVDLGTIAAGGETQFNAPVVCDEAGEAAVVFTANASLDGFAECEASDEASATVTCRENDIAISCEPVQACVGFEALVPVTVTNNANEATNVVVNWSIGGAPQTPVNVGVLAAGASSNFDAPVLCEEPGQVSVSFEAVATFDGELVCEDTAEETCIVTCGEAQVDVALEDIFVCVDAEGSVPGTVTNNSSELANITVTCSYPGLGEPIVTVFNSVAPGASEQFNVPITCEDPGQVEVTCVAEIALVSNPDCTGDDEDSATVTCQEACITASMEGATICVGVETELTLVLESCVDAPQNYEVVCVVDGQEVNVSGQIGPNATINVPVPVFCDEPGEIAVTCDVSAYLVSNEECADEDQATAVVTCLAPEIDIEKTTNPVETQDDSQVTLVITNTGPVAVDPVIVSDRWPAGVMFDAASLTGTCDVVANVDETPDYTEVTFSAFGLDPGESCTIMFDLICVEFTGEAIEDTAIVIALCDDLDATEENIANYAVRDTSYAEIVCIGGEACPHTIGFWRQQYRQRNNGSTKICLEGMYTLDRCAIELTGLNEWKLNEGGYVSTANLQAMSDADLFAALTAQMQGPRPMTHRDMAELQYLGVLLNTCAGALPLSTPLDGSGGFDGSVGEAIEGLEDALNNGGDVSYWAGVMDAINNRQGVLAADCPDGNDRYINTPPCDGSGEGGGIAESLAAPGVLTLQAYPNPANGAGTSIQYNIPSAMGATRADIQVFDVNGRLVRDLSQGGNVGLNQVNWDLRDNAGTQVAAGIYFYRLRVGGEQLTQRLLVIR